VPNDPLYPNQWYLPHIDAPQAWDTTTGSDTIVVAVIDSGVDIAHPDLAGNIWTNTKEISGNGIDDDGNGYIDDVHGWDFVANSSDPSPKFDVGWSENGVDHGTVVAGIIGAAGENTIGIAGVNWHASIMPLRVLNGAGVGDTHAIYQAVEYAINNGANFINLSFVGNDDDPLLAQAIDEAYANGIITFAAAGNEGVNLNSSPRYPACDKNVIGIGGTNQTDHRVVFYNGNGSIGGGSNYGSNCIDISAPAENFTSTAMYDPTHSLGDYYVSSWYGTSFAAPLVTGAAALIKANQPALTGDQIVLLLRANAVSLDSINQDVAGQMGTGRLSLAGIFSKKVPEPSNIVTAAGPGGGPHVRVFDQTGKVLSQFYAYATTFRGGVMVTAGNVSGDSAAEIITGTMIGAPHVRIFNSAGNVVSQFYAYATSFLGGVSISTGDVNADLSNEIIAAPLSGSPPTVKIFSDQLQLESSFSSYMQSFTGGVKICAIHS